MNQHECNAILKTSKGKDSFNNNMFYSLTKMTLFGITCFRRIHGPSMGDES